ncbi:radical SAM family heme chaperone HemW [Parasediminibacterium sp. JCM 36343]|uniref:radical SAM family heme chaperone HemW n=1 Tax=Parasediminibacterium sp. JCM 36343 TaxID=3374279 RepID=UPI00397B4940
MPGIYIHIPFCRKACHYCNFHFSTTHSLLPQMVEAIVAEMGIRKGYITGEINTIYFGGGTPSLCTNEQMDMLMAAIKSNFTVSPTAEITLEANPDDIATEKLLHWKARGINRLSIGVQSFREEDLRWMNRAHNASQAWEAIQLAKEYGFHNISIDLIYGTPSLSDEDWQANVKTAIALGIPHLSCYALTVEPKTALDKMIQLKKVPQPEAEKQARHFELLMQWLGEAGYEHYEISNFAKPGWRSKHNSSYWQGVHYMGLGPAAHSFNGTSRQWNIANNALYMQGIATQALAFEKEELTPTQTLNEYIMTSLRTMEGLSFTHITSNWGQLKADTIKASATKYIQQGSALLSGECLQLTKQGKLLADGIASDLFLEEG